MVKSQKQLKIKAMRGRRGKTAGDEIIEGEVKSMKRNGQIIIQKKAVKKRERVRESKVCQFEIHLMLSGSTNT